MRQVVGPKMDKQEQPGEILPTDELTQSNGAVSVLLNPPAGIPATQWSGVVLNRQFRIFLMTARQTTK